MKALDIDEMNRRLSASGVPGPREMALNLMVVISEVTRADPRSVAAFTSTAIVQMLGFVVLESTVTEEDYRAGLEVMAKLLLAARWIPPSERE